MLKNKYTFTLIPLLIQQVNILKVKCYSWRYTCSVGEPPWWYCSITADTRLVWEPPQSSLSQQCSPWTVPPWAGDNVSVTLYSPRRRCTPCKCAALPGMCVLRGVMDGRWRGRGDTPDPAPASLPRQRQRLLSNCINSIVTIYISAQPELRSHRQEPVLLV